MCKANLRLFSVIQNCIIKLKLLYYATLHSVNNKNQSYLHTASTGQWWCKSGDVEHYSQQHTT